MALVSSIYTMADGTRPSAGPWFRGDEVPIDRDVPLSFSDGRGRTKWSNGEVTVATGKRVVVQVKGKKKDVVKS